MGKSCNNQVQNLFVSESFISLLFLKVAVKLGLKQIAF